MNTNSYQTLLDDLKKAGELRNNWYLVASLTEKIKQDAAGPRQSAKRLKDASAASGFSTNTLNRMLAVREFFDSIKDGVTQLQGVDANALSFPSLEVVKRLHSLDSDAGRKMLTAVATGQIIFRELREYYNKVVSENTSAASAHQVARFEVRDFEEAALNAVNLASDKLFVKSRILTIEKPRDGRRPVDAEVYAGGPFPFSAFEFVLLRDPKSPKQTLENMLYHILFYSSFYESYWVVFASNTGTQRVSDFVTILDKLACTTIGVAMLPWDGNKQTSSSPLELQVIRTPTGIPNPDHRTKVSMIPDLRALLVRPMT